MFRVIKSNTEIANSAADCSIAFKFGTELHNVTSDTLQMFKVKGQRSRSQRKRAGVARAASNCNAFAIATFSSFL